MNTTLVGIPASNLADCWESIKHLIDGDCARSNGKYESVDILRSLLKGEMQIWGAVDEDTIEAIAIGEIVNYPRIRIYRMLAATGEDMKDWIDHIQGIETWAKSQGCMDFEAISRPGWARTLKDKGFKKTHEILNKNLSDRVLN
jgi:hypothetical protein